MAEERPNILDLRLDELEAALEALQEPRWRARQVHQWLLSHRIGSFSEMTTLSLELRRKLDEAYSIRPLETEKHDETAERFEGDEPGTTEKLLLRLPDGERVESVLIPGRGRLTACVSSQAGCPFNCSFCATGKMGYRRNLSAGEICAQVWALSDMLEQRGSQAALSNVVFMGMGEPLLNTRNVIEAVENLSSRKYRYSTSQRRITISTVGIIPEIDRLAETGLKTKLAVSLHTADQRKRETLMARAAREHPLDRLRKSLARYASKTGEPVTLAYMLLRGVNDSEEDAKRLLAYASGFFCKINLIDYNSIVNIKFEPVYDEARDRFRRILQDAGAQVTLRKSYGTSINAACGQLATSTMRSSDNQ
ncbi:23S rRNA (adenine(2503)-C(2))-methyltransferase RlmN [Chlorobium sp. N1]|uniref:23S rRNA (adenine(2503)-C(2))-methyltransferase RlmN n=1 Tax=Chlorobium sp. N1 TaxID=2491138 RepID=UPI00103BEE82|nr:23S rRNA (adenine(2503)-C(2))-methyltransferase RlmN [Chlorobium sp. N1]TCD48376.1 23S rRNA (adenine(2503)-C(2))-methyltransferase RlmN [Chlorobium sp. N1]